MTAGSFAAALDALEGSIVGLDREAEVLVAALDAGRHVVLEGPPGTGKSSLLRLVCTAAGAGFVFVEGNAELTPSRILGTHDPAMVMRSGYDPDAFMEGPLLRAMRDGGVLFVEEFNRIPEETLNVLITALEEGEVTIPRYGAVHADDGFRMVAAMNPFDAIGTARISHALSDRTCRIAIGYRSEVEERRIVALNQDPPKPLSAFAVALARRTRECDEIRIGSSVRGAIDLCAVAARLAEGRGGSPMDRDTLHDAALAALSGRIRLADTCVRTPDEVIETLFDSLWSEAIDERLEADEGKVRRLPRAAKGGTGER